MLDLWLSNIRKLMYENHDKINEMNSEDEIINYLVEENVLMQVNNIWKNPFIQKAFKNNSR